MDRAPVFGHDQKLPQQSPQSINEAQEIISPSQPLPQDWAAEPLMFTDDQIAREMVLELADSEQPVLESSSSSLPLSPARPRLKKAPGKSLVLASRFGSDKLKTPNGLPTPPAKSMDGFFHTSMGHDEDAIMFHRSRKTSCSFSLSLEHANSPATPPPPPMYPTLSATNYPLSSLSRLLSSLPLHENHWYIGVPKPSHSAPGGVQGPIPWLSPSLAETPFVVPNSCAGRSLVVPTRFIKLVYGQDPNPFPGAVRQHATSKEKQDNGHSSSCLSATTSNNGRELCLFLHPAFCAASPPTLALAFLTLAFSYSIA
ncbi:hypothetical protein BROUX41_004530 [Berkeleyomyces rouxiae]|uniref:uncharacterized protein n=1 Tax=Berkeleyomyces rouxiae TaxID=2035830 RepID=UPI003B78B231